MESEITKAMGSLQKAILSEMEKMARKHEVTIEENKRLQGIISEVAEILHNTCRMKQDKEERKVEKAWDILDKARSHA